MTEIMFQCPHCSEFMVGNDSLFGTEIQCPKCQRLFTAPPRPAERPLEARPAPAAAPAPTEPVPASDEESDIFEIAPSSKGFVPEIALGILLLPVVIGLYFLARVWIKTKSITYRLTTQRFIVRRGLIGKLVEEVELYRVKDVTVNQTVFQRMLGVGSITILSNDDSTPVLTLVGIVNPLEVKELIRKHYRAARRREGVRITEFDQP